MAGHEVALGFEFLIGLLTDSTLQGYAPGGVRRAYAPPETTPPYVIVGYQAGHDVTTMNAFRMMSAMLYQVKVVGPSSGTSVLAQAAERIDQLIDQQKGTVAGGYTLACWRQSPLEVDELVSGELWTNLGGLYQVYLEQT